jgi:hypothetical protein
VISVGPHTLLERGAELEGLAAQVQAARAAQGSVVVLEAPAGHGKTALLRVLRRRAEEAKLRVLTATGAPLERDFAFGVVRQLFDAEVQRADPDRAGSLFAGAARLAEPVFDLATAQDREDPTHSTLYGLYWLAANLAAEQPLLLAIDDAHWADAPSLRFLDALARRVEDLPLLLAVAIRPSEHPLLDGLVTAPATRVQRPKALSEQAVKELLNTKFDATDGFVRACSEVTRGNPLLLAELLQEPFTGSDDEITRVRTMVAPPVAARIRQLDPAQRAVIRATAVLGDATSLPRVAALAGVPEPEAAAALDALTRAHLLEDQRFVHPMVRETVEADLSADRARLHRRAAELLHADGARDGAVASHLLLANAGNDPWAAEILTRAGERALAEGAPDVALTLLDRVQPPTAATHVARGIALFRLGRDPLPALDLAAPDPRAAKLAAGALILGGRSREAAARLRRAIAQAPSHQRAEFEDQLVEALAYRDDDATEYLQTLEEFADSDSPTLLCHLAHARALAGAPRSEVLPAWRRAFADRTVFARLGVERFAALWAIEALHAVEAAA